MDFLVGKKTYIGIVLSFILVCLAALGVVSIDSTAVQLIGAVILAFTGVSYRKAIAG